MCKMPFYKMFPADAETDAGFRMMTYAERGVYWTCLNLCWINGGLPADPADRARMLGLSQRQADRYWVRIGRCFVSDADGMLVNPRQERERAEAIASSERAREKANKRWEKTPNDAAASPQHMPEEVSASPRASDSVSSYSSSVFVLPDPEVQRSTALAREGRFPDWWAVWSGTRGTNHKHQAFEAWRRAVPPDLEEAAIECAASYLASLDNPAKGYNPENFLIEQARDHFTARWPALRVLPQRETATEKAIRIGHERFEKYGRL